VQSYNGTEFFEQGEGMEIRTPLGETLFKDFSLPFLHHIREEEVGMLVCIGV
jgi:hypothetical protein